MLLVCGHGRRRARPTRAGFGRAAAQHPDAGGAGGRHVRELRERQLLPVRVHADLRADRARGRGGRRPRRRRGQGQCLGAVHPGAHRGPAGLVVEVRDARGHPEPARGAGPLGRRLGRELTLSLIPSYAVLCAAQAATVAAPARQAPERGRSWAWVAVPAALLGAGVLIINVVPQGPHWLARLATFGTPVLAAAGGFFRGSSRWWLWPPLAVGLWFVAWLASGLVQDVAGVALIAAACLAAASAAALVAPAWSIRVGLVALAVLDVILVWGTPSVQDATTTLEHTALPHAAGRSLPSLQQLTFGSALMGWLDLLAPALLGVVVAGRRKLAAAAIVGVAAYLFGYLLFTDTTNEVAATVPVLAGLAYAAADARRGRLRHPLEPARAGGGPRGDRRGGA